MAEDIYPLERLHVEQRGSGPRVVFVHGGEENGGAAAFAQQLPLAQSYTLVLPDLPGHGKSPAQGPKSPARDALLITQLLGDGAHLVGHSFGGAVALRVAAQRPELVRTLILVEPATFDIAADDPVVQQMLGQLAQAAANPDPRQRLIAFANAVGIHKNWPQQLSEANRRFAEDLQHLRPDTMVPSRQLAREVEAADVPSLVISGGDREAFEHLCDAMALALGGERAVISGYGHAPQLSGEPFNTSLQNFWHHYAQ